MVDSVSEARTSLFLGVFSSMRRLTDGSKIFCPSIIPWILYISDKTLLMRMCSCCCSCAFIAYNCLTLSGWELKWPLYLRSRSNIDSICDFKNWLCSLRLWFYERIAASIDRKYSSLALTAVREGLGSRRESEAFPEAISLDLGSCALCEASGVTLRTSFTDSTSKMLLLTAFRSTPRSCSRSEPSTVI